MTDDSTVRRIREAADVDDALIAKIHEFVDGRWEIVEAANGDKVGSWDDWLTRFERYYDVDLGGSLDSPAIRKIKDVVRRYLKE